MQSNLSEIIDSIIIPSDNNPLLPEFPSDNPKFPATKTYQVNVPGFKSVWLKDESTNPTGTHKDRMAWEVVVSYKEILKQCLKNNSQIPQMSIISSGSAALALQYAFNKYNLPNLKVLFDVNINPRTIQQLKSIGVETYLTDLSIKQLNWQNILELTNNIDGIDITSNKALNSNNVLYDWLSYEIINQTPDYCFIPFGSGGLYENILNIVKKECIHKVKDPRLSADIQKVKKCNFIGAGINNLNSKAATKLYAKFTPYISCNQHWLRFYRLSEYCGKKSDILFLQEKYLDKAIEIANDNQLTFEPSGIAGLGIMLQLQDKIDTSKKMLVVNTGKSKI